MEGSSWEDYLETWETYGKMEIKWQHNDWKV